MALNLWKAAGNPTAYNPLPTGWNNGFILGIGEYLFSVKAKSPSKTSFDIGTADGKSRLYVGVLTEDFKTYELKVNNQTPQFFRIADYNSKGDIVIGEIELVENSLPLRRSPYTVNLLGNVTLSQSGSGLPTFQADGTVLIRNTTDTGWAGIIYPVTKDELSSGSCDVYNPNNTQITVSASIAGANPKSYVVKPYEKVRVGTYWLSTVTANSTLRIWEESSKPFYASNFQKELGFVFTSYEPYGTIRKFLKPQKPAAKAKSIAKNKRMKEATR